MATLRHGTPEEAAMSPARVENLRRLGAGWVEDGTHQALVLLLARRGIIVLHEAFGKQGPEPDAAPLRTDAIFPLASLSKVFAATCAMMLVEEGLLGLNRPVQEYLPEFQGEGKENVLVHHLFTHTLGLRQADIEASFQEAITVLRQEFAARPVSATDGSDPHPIVAKLIEVECEAPLSYVPGQLMSYTPSVGYSLLCEIVRRLSGESTVRFARDRLFHPLGMNDTTYLLADADRERLVRRPPDSLTDLLYPILGRIPMGFATATSTALDMAKLGQMYLNRGEYAGVRVLSPPTIREMTRNQVPGTPAEYFSRRVTEASWGYGWGVMGLEKWEGSPSLLSAETFWHTGSSGVALYVDPRNELICVYFPVAYGSPLEQRRKHDLFANAAVAAIQD